MDKPTKILSNFFLFYSIYLINEEDFLFNVESIILDVALVHDLDTLKLFLSTT